jgi:hypothetical protein
MNAPQTPAAYLDALFPGPGVLYRAGDGTFSVVDYFDQSVKTTASPTFAAATLSGLTSGRIPFASTGGLITDSAALSWDGSKVAVSKNGANSDWIGLSAIETQRSGYVRMGVLKAADGTYALGGIWFTSATPTFSNYALLGAASGGYTFNVPSGESYGFRINNASKWTVNSSGQFVSGTDGTANIDLTTAGKVTAGSFAVGATAGIDATFDAYQSGTLRRFTSSKGIITANEEIQD